MSTSKLRRPCESCPWRVDAKRGYWDPTHFEEIWRNCQDDGMHVMLCHKSRKALARSVDDRDCHKSNVLPKADRGDVPCQGWIRVMGFSSIGVRLLAMRDKITIEEVEDRAGPKLFASFTAMLRANKIKIPRRSRWTR